MKKHSARRKHCALTTVPHRCTKSAMAVVMLQSPHRCTESAMAVVRQSQNFPQPQTPFPGAQDRQNLISWKHYLYLQTQFGEDRCTQFRVIVVTDTARPPATNTQTDRTDYNILRR